MNKPLPVVIKTPIKNTQAELTRLKFSLIVTESLAQAYWDGKENFGPIDIISLWLKEDQETENSDN